MPIAALLHITEEFFLPGGFRAWYARYRPETSVSFTTTFAVLINALLLAVCLVPPLLGPTPRTVALWLTIAALLAGNAWFHLRGALVTRQYSPGVVTGFLLYLPLAILGFYSFLHAGLASGGTALSAAVIGVSYDLVSARLHRRRARRQSALALAFLSVLRGPADRAIPNDNLTSAGRLAGGVLRLALESREAKWSPNGAAGPSLRVYAFAEAGKTASVPGPLIRVPAGTEIRATVHNTLPKSLWLRGLQDRTGIPLDSVLIAPG